MLAAFNVANKKDEKERKKDALDVDEFVDFYYLLMRRPEIDELFYKYADDKVNIWYIFYIIGCFYI